MPKVVYNRDISPEDEMRSLFPELVDLYDNNALRQAFIDYEDKAVRYKARYWALTKLALLLISVSIIFAIAYWVFDGAFPYAAGTAVIASISGIVGVGLELFLMFDRTKEKWISNRFFAERTRSYIAQLYAFGARASSPDEFSKLAGQYAQEKLVGLKAEIPMRAAAFQQFMPQKGVSVPAAIDNPDPKIFLACKKAYKLLRADFQERFATGEIARLSGKKASSGSVSDITFLMGVVLAVLSVALILFDLGSHTDIISKWLVFMGAVMFFISAFSSIIGLGNSADANIHRYQAYVDQLKLFNDESLSPMPPIEFQDRVTLIEIEAMRELDAFCRQLDSVSIRL